MPFIAEKKTYFLWIVDYAYVVDGVERTASIKVRGRWFGEAFGEAQNDLHGAKRVNKWEVFDILCIRRDPSQPDPEKPA